MARLQEPKFGYLNTEIERTIKAARELEDVLIVQAERSSKLGTIGRIAEDELAQRYGLDKPPSMTVIPGETQTAPAPASNQEPTFTTREGDES